MKFKSLFCVLFVFVFSTVLFAQSVEVTTKKVVYQRPQAEMESKKTFMIEYPQVKAATPILSQKIEAILAYEKAFPYLNIKEQENNEDNSLSSAYYEINYNERNILDITLLYDAVTAYPSTFRKNLVINTKTGTRVLPADVFTNLDNLAVKVRTAQLSEIKKAKEEYKKDPENGEFEGDYYFKNAKFTRVELNNFTVSDKGVTFNYNYEFPHVALALQPDGKYFYSWTELKPFIKRGGLLAQFIR